MKKQTTRSNKMWTKQEVLLLEKLWDTKTAEDIATELERPVSSIKNMAMQMKKAGFQLTTKRKNNYLRAMLSEILDDRKKKK
jgi:hypothetical protein